MKKDVFEIGEHYNLVISVFGKRGGGKTFLTSKISRGFERTITFDTRNRIGVKGDNEKVYDCLLEGEKFYDFEKLCEAIERKAKKYHYIFKPRRPEMELEYFCECVDTQEVNDALIWIEEIGLLTSAGYHNIPENLEKLLRFGRHHRIHLIVNAQRPSDVHRTITAESSHIICFRQNEPRDLQYLSGYFGEHTRRIPDLKKHHFLLWHEGEVSEYDANGKQVSTSVKEPIKNVPANQS